MKDQKATKKVISLSDDEIHVAGAEDSYLINFGYLDNKAEGPSD